MADSSKQRRYVFIWKIKNFLSCHIAYPSKFSSPTFEVADLSVKNWEFWLQPEGNSTTDYFRDKIVVFLMRKRPDEYSESVFLDIRLEMLDIDGVVFMSEEEKNYEMRQMGYWGRHFKTLSELRELMKSWNEDTLTLRCNITINITNENQDGLQYKEFEALTIIDVDRFVFKWDISHTGCFDWSEKISVPNSIMPDLKIDMSIAPDEAVKIKIQLLNKSSSDELIMFRMKFLSSSGIKLGSMCEIHLFESTDSYVFPPFICLKDLSIGNSLPRCYKYTFISECIVSKKSITYSKVENRLFNSFIKKECTALASSSSLQSDFRELFVNKKHSDVKLRVNGTDYLAHKVVLATRSPVFSSMFDQDMLENHTGMVHIEDIDDNTLQNLLEFMYTDTVTVSEMEFISILNLLLAADKYQVQNLKDKCSSEIMSLLSEENVCEVIVVADMINHDSLKTFALNFIFENASKVLSAPNWYLWIAENMRLATEVLCKLSNYLKRSEEE